MQYQLVCIQRQTLQTSFSESLLATPDTKRESSKPHKRLLDRRPRKKLPVLAKASQSPGASLRKSVSTDDLGGGRGRKRSVKGKGKEVAKNSQMFHHSVERLPTLTPFDEERICWLKVGRPAIYTCNIIDFRLLMFVRKGSGG